MSLDLIAPRAATRPARKSAGSDAEALYVVATFQSEGAVIREAPGPRLAHATVLSIAGFLACMIAIMTFMRLDRIVTSTSGKIVTTEQIQVFGALDAAIIKSLDAKEGDEVQKGQLLATLDPTFAAADVTQLKLQVASLEAQVARDDAQLDGQPWVPGPQAELEPASYLAVQKKYYDQQIGQYKAQIASFDAKIAQSNATIKKYEQDGAAYDDRVAIAQKIENMRGTLAQHGYGSQLNFYIAEDSKMEVARTRQFDQNSLDEARHTLASQTADRDAFVKQWSTQLSQDLVTARNALDNARAQLEKANRHKDLVRLVAPDHAVILTLAKLSVGSVLKAGDTLFTLMPADKPVAAEVNISARDIGFIRAGDPCRLKIDAFNFMEHGTADGVIRWISDNAFTTSDDDEAKAVDPYYKARCQIVATHFVHTPPKFRLIPGMTLTADVKVGTRSVAMYLLGGVMRSVSESMREP